MNTAVARRTAAIACLLACSMSASASADERSLTVGYQPAWFVLAGGTGGASFGSDQNGGFIGAELSVARMFRGWWYGVYADGFYDFGMQTPSASFGPEFGYWVLGLDGGVGIRPAAEKGLDIGPTVQGLITLGIFSIYYRHGFWPGATENANVRQVGVLLKMPLGAAWGTGAAAPANMGTRRQ